MTIRKLPVALLATAFCSTAFAQRLPEYYPDGFQRTGKVDDIREEAVVVNDILYALSDSVVVHSLSGRIAAVATVRPGALIGYRVGASREIVEIWLLPSTYKESRGRR